ncbi:methionine adenosyltransferase 2 subunit beta isoform X4 [Hypanus sabinus]|uniref:methionine adenosyltransferase 2 subunit beta isoform X4 n=1 Tax=Hypanus sabinus TaxID=79690 RepID=UPI0028C49C55|nr:methionine adenosyltransferase 2 subunit beta isoform X4 [Hypanus sabinus]
MVGKEKELTIHFSPGCVQLLEVMKDCQKIFSAASSARVNWEKCAGILGQWQEDVSVPDRRVLVTGATGLLGRAVYKEFAENGWDAVGCGYRRARPRFEKVNLLEAGDVRRIIQEVKPHAVVHCAAERRPDVVQNRPDYAQQLNVNSSACIAKESGAAVLRVPVLYGPIEELEESAVCAIFSSVQSPERLASVDHWQQRFPTHVADVARVCRELSERRMQDSSVSGIFHWSGNERMTKYEIACTMADVFRLPRNHLQPVTDPPPTGTLRPHDARLDCSRLERMGIGQRTPFRLGLKRCLWPFLRDKQWQQTVFH